MPRMTLSLVCPQCGARFQAEDARRVYCSAECRRAHGADASAQAADRCATERLRRESLESFEAVFGDGRNG